MSINASMNIAQQALNVNQIALNVVSNNVANMNTAGYLKQRVDQIEMQGYTPYSSSSGIKIYTGGGVAISNIGQYSNQMLFNYMNDQNAQFEKINSMLGGANDLANIMNELGDKGLTSSFTNFYTAAQQLSANPSDSVLRINYVNAAQQVADKFNEVSKSITDKRSQLVGTTGNASSIKNSEAGLITQDINSKLKQLAELNDSIVKTSTGGSVPNNIINERNSILNELSSLVDFTATENANGTMNIDIAGMTMVSGGEQVAQLQIIDSGNADNPSTVQLVSMDNPPKVKIDDIFSKIDGGQLKGVLTAGSNTADGVTFQKVLDQIQALAKTFTDNVNKIQQFNDGNSAAAHMGLDADGKKVLVVPTPPDVNEPIFVTDADGKIKVNQAVLDDPNQIATARVKIPATADDLKAIGNSDNLKEIIALQNANFADTGGTTMGGFLKSLVTQVGLQASELTTKAKAQANVVDQTSSKYYSEGGVNLNEELMDMIKYQRAFEASSRIFSTCNEIMQVMVNLGR